ncbi:MAG: peptidoglycan DD-metalloendopeptidase family protein [Beijerinckiaceae bacterium]|nr:peptidoglycan DD-metalloendopeptidase family protein [Beijerinckiaceae bacterium]MCI0736121.1 peptidoglycan DD-metalloendopeptidase family protein [Beijerinckiaceae bacterium]
MAFVIRHIGISTTGAATLAVLELCLLSISPACFAAQTVPQAGQNIVKKDSELSSRRLELRGMEDTLETSQEQRRKIEAEIAAIRADRAKITAALLNATQNVNATERKITETETRLDTLTGSQDAIKRSLMGRKAVIAEILASLQRMGRKPPPALLAAPEDMLAAIRTSMLLGSALPQMRGEAEALAADLSDLMQLRQSIAAERETLSIGVAKLRAERQRLAALVEARQSALYAAEQALDAERDRALDLAKQAASLKDLIARMEAEVAAAARGAESARKAEETRKRAAEAAQPDSGIRTALAPFKDPARLAPAAAFIDTKGLLPFPVNGMIQRGYGSRDGFGGTEKGMLIAARSEAIVTAPCDGWVSFAGPYRSYGQLLIVNAGQGYYIILAGMDKINVNVGQFILAGEPVAVMGDGPVKTAAAIAIGAVQPVLYVEFRKDGVAIDPGPWWAKPELQKVRG